MFPLSVRDQLTQALGVVLPSGWRLVPWQGNLDGLDSPTVMLKQVGIKNAPSAPQGVYVFSYVLTVIEPTTDPERAEPLLDDEVETLWAVLDRMSWIDPQEAKKVLFQEACLAYDITADIITEKD